MNGDIEQKLRKMERWMKDKAKGVKTIMGGGGYAIMQK